MRATWNGTVIAESDDTVVVEGNHYFPPGAEAGREPDRRPGGVLEGRERHSLTFPSPAPGVCHGARPR